MITIGTSSKAWSKGQFGCSEYLSMLKDFRKYMKGE